MKLVGPNKKLFALIYGQSGSGKTHLAATYCWMHPDENVFLVDCDKGTETLEAKEFVKTTPNLYVIDLQAFKDLNQLYELCAANDVKAWADAIPGLGQLKKPFKCGIFDTWTEMQWLFLQELRARNGLGGKGLDFRKNIEIQHWQQMTDLNHKSVIAFRDLQMEFIFCAQQGTNKDELTGQVFKGPAIHGKLVSEMPGWFSTVIYTYNTPAGGWKATTQSKLGWPAKIRGKQGKDIENPTLEALLS